MSAFKKLTDFIREVRVEMKKVTWPKNEEVVSSTIVVIVSSFILGMYLGVADFVLSTGIRPVLQGSPNILSVLTLAAFGALLVWIYRVIQEG